MTKTGKTMKAAALAMLGLGALAVVSATVDGTLIMLLCLALAAVFTNESHRKEYQR